MSLVFKKAITFFAKQYQSIVSARVASYGLKYQDLLVEQPDVLKALSRSSGEVVLEREKRIKRAFDLSAKRKTLYSQYQPKDPMDHYIKDELKVALLEREQREILNHY